MRSLQYMIRRFYCRATLVLLYAGSMLQPIDAVRAQTVLGTATFYQVPEAGQQRLSGPESPPAVDHNIAPAQANDRSAKAQPPLRHLPGSQAGWRIDGEMGSLDWQIYMTVEEAAATRRFRFAYMSSASVLPDVSTVTLRINDVTVGQAAIAAPGDLKPVDFDIPPNALRRGFNAISMSVEQRHRVDCTTDATYELWTQLDPAQTGFVTTVDRSLKVTDLAALRPRGDGTLVIRILFEGRMRPQRIDQTILVAQAIALAGKSERLLVTFVPDPDANFGVNLVVGAAAEVAGALGPSDARSDISGPSLVFKPGRAGVAPTLIVTGSNDDDVAKAVTQLIKTIKFDEASAASVRKATGHADPLEILGGERIRLGDIGRLNEFSGRFFRLPIDVQMPADFLAADYGKLTFNLSGAYAAGLLGGAQVQVNLNGQDAASVPLSNPSGGIFHHNDIVVPLGGLRPGRNVIEIAAKLPNGADLSCDGASTLDNAAKRFLLLGESEIRFPRLARVGQMPELLQTTAGGYPYSVPDSHPKLYVPTPDRDSLSAAVTLAVRLSVAAGRPIPFALILSNPQGSSGHGLVVAPARSLDPGVMREIGMDPDAIRRDWEDRSAAKATPAVEAQTASGDIGRLRSNASLPPSRGAMPVSFAGSAGRSPSEIRGIVSEGAGTVPVDGWADLLARRSFLDRLLDMARNFTRPIVNATSQAIDAVRDVLFDRTPPRRIHHGAAASLIVAQGYRNGNGADVITIVTAPEAKTLARTVEALVDPARWSDLRGRLVAMNSSAQVLETVEASHVRLIQTQPASLNNSRLILAGWLSLHPTAYVISALLMAALLAFATNSLVKNVGRKNG